MSVKKVSGEERKAALLKIGMDLAVKHGAINVTRRMVAEKGKVSEALVTNYFGPNADAQKAYRRALKKAGLSEPSADKIEQIGIKLRAHKPKDARDSRPRSLKEVKAIKEKKANKTTPAKGVKPFAKAAKPAPKKAVKPKVAPGPSETKVIAPKETKAPRVRKSAARAPKLPPPVLPPALPETA